MKALNFWLATGTVGLTCLSVPAFGENFDGSFSGSYASGWTATINDNPGVVVSSSFNLSPFNLTLTGATSPIDLGVPYSSITFSHIVVGSGPTQIDFRSLFFAENLTHPGDSAEFLANGVPLVSLSSVSGSSVDNAFTLSPGDIFGFRLTSDNDSTADFLQITAAPVPEPSSAALAILGGMILARFGAYQRRQ